MDYFLIKHKLIVKIFSNWTVSSLGVCVCASRMCRINPHQQPEWSTAATTDLLEDDLEAGFGARLRCDLTDHVAVVERADVLEPAEGHRFVGSEVKVQLGLYGFPVTRLQARIAKIRYHRQLTTTTDKSWLPAHACDRQVLTFSVLVSYYKFAFKTTQCNVPLNISLDSRHWMH